MHAWPHDFVVSPSGRYVHLVILIELAYLPFNQAGSVAHRVRESNQSS